MLLAPRSPAGAQAGISPFRDLSEKYRTFRLEWLEGDGGYLRWYIDGSFVFEVPAAALDKYSVCTQTPDDAEPRCETTPRRKMPSEPMSIVINTALGSWNGGPEATNGHMPGQMFVDYVRVWQRKERRNVGCDPPDYPTKTFIDANSKLYGTPAKPRGYDSCPQQYPPRRGAGGGSAGAEGARAGLGARRRPSPTWMLGFVAVSLSGLGVLMAAYAAIAARLRAQSGAPSASQYGEVGNAAAASREPMLR